MTEPRSPEALINVCRATETLVCHLIDGQHMIIRAAPQERAWMDATHQRYAYRCLPLNIANSHGWEILCPGGFTATWNGTQDKAGVAIVPDEGQTVPAVSHFGSGIVTFHIPCVFRTDPGTDLYVTGPLNRPKDAVAPLTGIVETDWAPYSFTMNWMITRPRHPVRFEKGEPICHFFPIRRGILEQMEPRIVPLSQAPDVDRRYHQWSDSRLKFNADLNVPGSQAVQDRWQKNYFRGQHPGGEAADAGGHRVRLRLREFKP